MSKSVRIGINGFGRIGRCFLRALFANKHHDYSVVAINGLGAIDMATHLLKYDSVHGRFNHDVRHTDHSIIIDGIPILYQSIKEIEKITWDNVDIIMECTGKFNTYENANKHISYGGAKKVILSSPSQSIEIPVLICGVTDDLINKDANVVSLGSCTTNATIPLINLIHNKIGIKSGFVGTIHSYTHDQNLLDNNHKDFRRSRSAALSMIPTSTGLNLVISKIFPDLANKIQASCVRVPTPNVSMIDATFLLKQDTNIKYVNDIFNAACSDIIGVTKDNMVSIDFVGSTNSTVVDLLETKVIDNNLLRLLAWYDNEWAFVHRMLDAVKIINI